MATETFRTAHDSAQATVKLIVWDLDETIWRGTLSETETEPIAGRADLLNALVDHGIMVSVCSKNDSSPARRRLADYGLWDLFIFPRIDWRPKGPEVRAIVEAAQFRAENVLFIDDNPLNRAEVAWNVPGIQTLDPRDPGFDERMARVLASGKDDARRSRLAEYKLLEAKASEAATFGDNREFLRSCNIHIAIAERPGGDADRIHELLARTNQLNYTKRRASIDEVRDLLADTRVRSLAIRVWDRFGEYGLVGFAAVRGAEVLHFAFSCRVLNMGVEQWVWHELGAPAFAIAEPVSVPLGGERPDWIQLDDPGEPRRPTAVPAVQRTQRRLLFIGGCDLEQATAFISVAVPVATHFNYVPRSNPKLTVHRDSIDLLLADHLSPAQRRFILDTSPFLDARAFDVPTYVDVDDVVYSPLIDYVQAKYTSPEIPGFFNSYGDLLSPRLDETAIAQIAMRSGVDPQAMKRFAEAWAPTEKPDDVYRDQLHELFRRMTDRARVTVLVGATTTHGSLDAERFATHVRLNALVRDVAREFGNVAVIEVDPLIESVADFAGSIRHYQRRVYHDLARQITARIGGSVRPSALATLQRGLARAGRRLRRT